MWLPFKNVASPKEFRVQRIAPKISDEDRKRGILEGEYDVISE
jgi:hypothetical protein